MCKTLKVKKEKPRAKRIPLYKNEVQALFLQIIMKVVGEKEN